MPKKSFVAINKQLVALLHVSPAGLTPSQLETKLNTSDTVIRNHLEDLTWAGIVAVTRHAAHQKNGKPYRTVTLTAYGRQLASNTGKQAI